METNLKRIEGHIDRLSEFNATPGAGITRFSYSREYLQAGEYLSDYLKGLGLEVRLDSVGNIRARLEGSRPELPVVMTGSHLDTVLHGGKYDGVLGIVGGLEALTVLVENNHRPVHSVELIAFTEEEGSRFSAPLAGSKFMTGDYTVADLKRFRDDRGVTMYEAAENSGLNPAQPVEIIRPGRVKAMLELHVEQGAILDKKGIPVGLVRAVAGMKWVRIVFKGVANHAGTTPMEYRKDPLLGAARVITALERVVKKSPFPTTVGTVGKIDCSPNKANVIPGEVEFMLDIRDVEQEGIDYVVKEIEREAREIADLAGLEAEITVQGEKEPIELDQEVLEVIEGVIKELDIPYLNINSGALHDTSVLSRVAPVGMIFVPSKNGLSHTPAEETGIEEIKIGCDILTGAILKLSGSEE